MAGPIPAERRPEQEILQTPVQRAPTTNLAGMIPARANVQDTASKAIENQRRIAQDAMLTAASVLLKDAPKCQLKTLLLEG